MDSLTFVRELEAFKNERLAPIVGAGRISLEDGAPGDGKKMLQIALANEISVSELAARWMPSTPEIDVKLALAKQAGDEASHFRLVADRLSALGFDVAGFQGPGAGDRGRLARSGHSAGRQCLLSWMLSGAESK